MSKNLSKYIASFEYFDESLIVLPLATGSISITSFAIAIKAPVGIMSASCSLAFIIITGFVEKFLKAIRNKKKKHNGIVMVKSKKKINEGIKGSKIINNSLK